MDFGYLLVTIPSFLFVLGIVVFVHEFGHYIVGRWCGIHAEVFSIGFGREVFAWVDRRGTRWRVGLVPLGGYVKYLGDADATSRADTATLAALSPAERDRSFPGASVGRRALSVAAGPVFNFVLSIAVFAGLAVYHGRAVDGPVIGAVTAPAGFDVPLRPGDRLIGVEGQAVERVADLYRIADEMTVPGPLDVEVERAGERLSLTVPYPRTPLIGGVVPRSAALKAGLRENDIILSADGKPTPSFRDVQALVLAAEGRELSLEVLRDGVVIPVALTPVVTEIPDGEGGFRRQAMIGVLQGLFIGAEVETPLPWEAVGIGAGQTWAVITGSLSGLAHILSGDVSASNLQGPLGIAQLSGDTARSGLSDLVNLMAVISTAIGLMNLFPIPVLDGGHLVFLGVEAARGRPPAARWMELASTVGLALVLLLMLFATYNDLMRL